MIKNKMKKDEDNSLFSFYLLIISNKQGSHFNITNLPIGSVRWSSGLSAPAAGISSQRNTSNLELSELLLGLPATVAQSGVCEWRQKVL